MSDRIIKAIKDRDAVATGELQSEIKDMPFTEADKKLVRNVEQVQHVIEGMEGTGETKKG